MSARGSTAPGYVKVVWCCLFRSHNCLIYGWIRRTHYGCSNLSGLSETTTNNTMGLSDSEVAFIAFISTFLFLSFLSNMCVVVVMIKIKTLRTVTNMFLTNLAVSDMILVSLILPLQVHDISHTDDYYECK